jgi:hypothetical protein
MDGMHRDGEEQAGLGGSRSLFLSLYLVLLAFFIALISVSTFEEKRTRAVVDSLWSTFSGPKGTPRDLVLPSQSGLLLGAARQFFTELGGFFQAAIPAAKIKAMSGGSVLEVTLRGDALFRDNSADLRPGQFSFVDRLIAALSSAPAGVRRHMDVSLSTGGASNAILPGPASLEQRRAVALGTLLMGRGAPPDGLGIGLAPGPFGLIILSFRVLPECEGQTGEDWRDERKTLEQGEGGR